MTVSILVPVYGVERYIERCAVSLFEQTYEDIEYIFVDDCTPDSSMRILEEVLSRYPHRKSQVRTLHHEHNKGLGGTRATALAAATGDFVMHVDSDDYLPQTAVATLVTTILSTDADIVEGAYQTSDAECHLSEPILPYHGSDKRYLKLFLCQNIVPNYIWGRIYKRSLYTEHDITPMPGIDLTEDFMLKARLLYCAKKRVVTDEVVYYYNIANLSSYTHTMSQEHLVSHIRSNEVVYEFFKKHDKKGEFSLPLQLGVLNALRVVRENGYMDRLSQNMAFYKPKGIVLWLLTLMLRSEKIPFPVANFCYRAVRRLFKGIKLRKQNPLIH